MSGWIALLVYAGGYLFTYRKAYLVMTDAVGDEDAADRGATAIMTLLACTVWPLVLGGWVIWRFLTPKTQGEREEELREREHAAAERERHIARLERELGIGEHR